MDDKLTTNQLRAIQSIVEAARAKNRDDALEALGKAAWFIKQETERLLTEELREGTKLDPHYIPRKETHHVSS